jgi:hypothetical protein
LKNRLFNFYSSEITHRQIKFGIILYVICMTIIAFVAKGTGDEGDSIQHYLFAKQAWQYKQHFFDHWAKPVYVLISFPFAQFGLTGVKIMNVLLNAISIWYTYKITENLQIKRPWIPALILVSIPMFNHLSLSGLTEPMGACLLISGLYLMLKEKWISSTILLSFLPFVRSEGLLMLGTVFLYLLIRSKYKYLPLLLTGHIVYGILGSFYNDSVFWVFNKLSYATWSSAYGSGEWLHFVRNLPEITGTCLTLFLTLGILYGFVLLIRYFRKQTERTEEPELFLLYGSCIVFFLAHSAFWALGIFNSGGILRVMITIMPLMAIIAYRGILFGVDFMGNEKIKRVTVTVLTIFIFLYPFSGHIFAYRWQRDFQPKADQYAQQELGQWLQKTYPDYHQYTFYYEAVYISEVLDIDWFNKDKRKRLLDAFVKNEFRPGDFIIWDDWFAVVEGHIPLKELEADTRVQKLAEFKKMNYWGGIRNTVVFRWK